MSREGCDTHIVLVTHRHAEAEEEVGDVGVSRRAGPVQRGPVVLRERGGGSGGERAAGKAGAGRRLTGAAPQAARSRPGGQGRLGRPRPADLVGLGGQGPVTQQLGPQLLQAPGIGQVTDPHVGHRTLHVNPATGAAPRPRRRPIRGSPGPAQPIAPTGVLLSASRAAGAAGICSPTGARRLRCHRSAGLHLPGCPAPRPCCASVSGRGGGW